MAKTLREIQNEFDRLVNDITFKTNSDVDIINSMFGGIFGQGVPKAPGKSSDESSDSKRKSSDPNT